MLFAGNLALTKFCAISSSVLVIEFAAVLIIKHLLVYLFICNSIFCEPATSLGVKWTGMLIILHTLHSTMHI